MKNIELKVKVDNLDIVRAKCRAVHAKHVGSMAQIDTYFRVNFGRLKVREIDNQECVLIHYERPDLATHKISDFELLNLDRQKCRELKYLLSKTCGTLVVVKKRRELWLHGNTRIHLDSVVGLGNFVELESMVKNGMARARKEYNFLIKELQLDKFKAVHNSYSDLLIERKLVRDRMRQMKK